MDLGLSGKIAMVAAASKGLGFAVARTLSVEGARVSIQGLALRERHDGQVGRRWSNLVPGQ